MNKEPQDFTQHLRALNDQMTSTLQMTRSLMARVEPERAPSPPRAPPADAGNDVTKTVPAEAADNGTNGRSRSKKKKKTQDRINREAENKENVDKGKSKKNKRDNKKKPKQDEMSNSDHNNDGREGAETPSAEASPGVAPEAAAFEEEINTMLQAMRGSQGDSPSLAAMTENIARALELQRTAMAIQEAVSGLVLRLNATAASITERLSKSRGSSPGENGGIGEETAHASLLRDVEQARAGATAAAAAACAAAAEALVDARQRTYAAAAAAVSVSRNVAAAADRIAAASRKEGASTSRSRSRHTAIHSAPAGTHSKGATDVEASSAEPPHVQFSEAVKDGEDEVEASTSLKKSHKAAKRCAADQAGAGLSTEGEPSTEGDPEGGAAAGGVETARGVKRVSRASRRRSKSNRSSASGCSAASRDLDGKGSDYLTTDDEDYSQSSESKADPEVDQRSPLVVFREHLQRDGLQLSYWQMPHRKSGRKRGSYSFCCCIPTLDLKAEAAGQYKQLSKRKATYMLAQEIVKLQKEGNLPEKISPFSEEELQQLSVGFEEEAIDAFDVKLREECNRMQFPSPEYQVISQPNSEQITIKCSALNMAATGTSMTKKSARKLAARAVFELHQKGSKDMRSESESSI